MASDIFLDMSEVLSCFLEILSWIAEAQAYNTNVCDCVCVFMCTCMPVCVGLVMCLWGSQTIVLAKGTHDFRRGNDFFYRKSLELQITVIEHLLFLTMSVRYVQILTVLRVRSHVIPILQMKNMRPRNVL